MQLIANSRNKSSHVLLPISEPVIFVAISSRIHRCSLRLDRRAPQPSCRAGAPPSALSTDCAAIRSHAHVQAPQRPRPSHRRTSLPPCRLGWGPLSTCQAVRSRQPDGVVRPSPPAASPGVAEGNVEQQSQDGLRHRVDCRPASSGAFRMQTPERQSGFRIRCHLEIPTQFCRDAVCNASLCSR